MTRAWRLTTPVIVVLLMTAMVVAAPIETKLMVGGGTGNDLASIHSTDADFDNATLTNLTVEGTGDSATVETTRQRNVTIDDAEDNDISEYSGDTNRFTTDTSRVKNGTYAIAGGTGTSGGSHIIRSTSGLEHYPKPGDKFSVWINRNSISAGRAGFAFGVQDSDSYYEVQIDYADDTTRLRKNDNGTVTVLDSINAEHSADSWHRIIVDWEKTGDITVAVDWSGTDLSATDTKFTDGGIHFQTQIAEINDPGTDTWFDYAEIWERGETPGEYIHSHDVDRTGTGFTNITTAENVSVTATWKGDSDDDGTYETTLNQTTVSSTGNHTYSWSKFNGDVQLNLNVSSTTDNWDFALADEGVLFTASSPSVNNSSNSPSNETELQSGSTTLEIDVEDEDFATGQGDSVTVEYFLEKPELSTFESVGTDTLSSNGTASLSYTPAEGGEYEWYVVATDSYGETTQSATFNFTTPSVLTLRNESNASEIITGASATITFFGADGTTVVEKSDNDNDGNISLAGLPNQNLVAVIEANGWHTRRVYIESLYDQDSIYLLNDTTYPGIDTQFVYEDRTSNYPPDETILKIQRAVDANNDGTFQWETVAGDFWGAAGEFPFTGEENARYRLIIKNTETGDQRTLGTHIPTADGTKDIIVGRIEWPAGNSTGRFFDAELNTSSDKILITYSDPTDNTSSVRFIVHELGNESNEIYNVSHSGTYGTINDAVTLTNNQSEDSWVVKYEAETSDDGQISGQVTVGGNAFGLPVDPWLMGSLGYVFLTFVACLYGPRTATLGAWTLIIMTAVVMIFQWWTVPTSSFIAATLVAIGTTFYKEGLP